MGSAIANTGIGKKIIGGVKSIGGKVVGGIKNLFGIGQKAYNSQGLVGDALRGAHGYLQNNHPELYHNLNTGIQGIQHAVGNLQPLGAADISKAANAAASKRKAVD